MELLYEEYRHSLIWKGALHKEPKLSKDQAISQIKSSNAWMLRNIYDFDCKEETNFWYIIKDKYDEALYSKKTQKYIAKANVKFAIGLISKKMMLEQGYDVYESAHRRYKIHDGFQMNKEQYINELTSLSDDYQFWGCVDKDTGLLQAYSVCQIQDNICWYKYSRANPDFLPKYYPMYGMYDARDKYYLKECKFDYVMTSARSITNHSEIQDFMIEKFGFRKAYCRLGLYYRSWLKCCISLLFPFRNVVPIRIVKNLLNFEAINRGIL